MGKTEAFSRTEIPPGTLYMLILKSLARLGPMHGYGIAAHIQQQSEDVLQVEEGSLYPALQRMLIKGWVVAEWGQSENNRRARYYHLTPAGKKQLSAEISEFERVMTAIGRVIQPA
jgi:transcriptional regulator